jgi:endonuclease/exonuclease/phosphatase (EEP) superfamily protein YafD
MDKKTGASGRNQSPWPKVARATVLLVALGVLFVWLVLSSDPESHPALALLQYVPFVAYVLPAVLAVCVSAWLGWVWRVVALGSLALILTSVMGLAWGEPDEGYGHIRFMTYNVKAYLATLRPHGTSELALEIMQHDPDVVVMQDAGQLIGLQQGQPEVFKAIMGKREFQAFGQYIIASRLPIKDCSPGFIPYRNQQHTYFHCVLIAHGKEIDLVTVHFTTPRDGLNATRHEGLKGLDAWNGNMNDRLVQSGVLAERLRLMKRPRIVAGDLNAPESSTVVQTLLHTGLRDAFSVAGKGYGYTHGHSLWPGLSFLRIDHILVSEEIGVEDAFAGGKIASQHRPVIADLLVVRH